MKKNKLKTSDYNHYINKDNYLNALRMTNDYFKQKTSMETANEADRRILLIQTMELNSKVDYELICNAISELLSIRESIIQEAREKFDEICKELFEKATKEATRKGIIVLSEYEVERKWSLIVLNSGILGGKTKSELGQFFTKKKNWLTKPVIEFIENTIHDNDIILDPFAGNGDLFRVIDKNVNFVGYDIEERFGWEVNDSLLNIPIENENTFILTNPPYLAKNSCKRNGYLDTYEKYFLNSKYDNLYLIALDRIISTNKPGLAIVPETFINSSFNKEKINRIIIVEETPFEDTDYPVCVVCFNANEEGIKIYKNDDYVGELEDIINLVPKSNKKIEDLKFNVKEGKIAIKCTDTNNPNKKIEFVNSEYLKYSTDFIKETSRAITIVKSIVFEICSKEELELIIAEANNILNDYRFKTQDVLLSPFKSNNTEGKRRRRLDFNLARNILEIACENVLLK